MVNSRWIYAAFWLVLCPVAGRLPAATNTRQTSRVHYTITSWGTETGLPSSAVISMAQTRDGYLWLGTLNGLVRFDGREFKVFNRYNTPGLGSSQIVFLYDDSRSNLWVGTEAAGAALIRNGEVKSIDIGRGSREGRLIAACEEANGAVWLATANGQLCRYHDGEMNVWTRPEFSNCRGLSVEGTNWLVLATDRELFAFDPKAVQSGKDLPQGLHFVVLGGIDYLLSSRSGGFWLLANGQVRKFRLNHSELELARDVGRYPWTSTTQASAACEDREGNLIVGTQNETGGEGVFWFRAHGEVDHISSAENLSHNGILSLCVDREGSLWVGTAGGGVNRVTVREFDVLGASRGVTIKSVCEDDQGGVWFGTFGGGLRYWKDGKLKQIGSVDGAANYYVGSVFVDTNHVTWVGVLRYGLFKFQNEYFSRAPGMEAFNPNVSVLYQDRRGDLWVGSEGGLASWDGHTWTNYDTDAVQAVADDAAGNLWIGTANGLSRLRDGKLNEVHPEHDSPGEDVSALLTDNAGVLWVGTRGNGLMRFADDHWTHYTTDNGLAVNSINYLIEDRQGYLWMGSFRGLMRVPKKDLNELAQGRVATIRCRTYDTADGLITAECSWGSQPAAWRAHNGTLLFSTSRGLVSVDPAKLTENTNPPPVMIEAVYVDDVLQNTNRLRSNGPTTVTIPPGKERLEIRYTSLNLRAPERARFKYWMQGYEKTWTDVGNRRVAPYTKLPPPGEYLFHVTACNEDGVWNKAGAVMTIIIETPFWQTWWFRGAALVGLLGLIVATVHYISTQKLQRQVARMKQQEALERERARIARDLHDQLGANLTQVSLLGEMVEADKDVPNEVEDHAKQISQTARDTARALDEIVWAANPSNDTLDSLVTYACKYAQEYLALAGLSHRLEVPDQLPSTSVPPDVRHNVFLAFKEAVNNVVKHAHATAVRIRLLLDADRFSFEIDDNGRGLTDADRRKGRNGLLNMRKRMEDVGGEFTVGPGAEHGTRVRLTAPMKKN
jgi:signal transduction histidine kinase/ligand-binding sensor domain-containing protein